VDKLTDAKIEEIESVVFAIDGMEKDIVRDVQAFGLAVPQMGKASVDVTLSLNMEFSSDHIFKIEFNGPWDRYKRFRTVAEQFAGESSAVSAKMTVKLVFDSGIKTTGGPLEMIKGILTSLNVGRIRVAAKPKK
jgi:hypothetical protein